MNRKFIDSNFVPTDRKPDMYDFTPDVHYTNEEGPQDYFSYNSKSVPSSKIDYTYYHEHKKHEYSQYNIHASGAHFEGQNNQYPQEKPMDNCHKPMMNDCQKPINCPPEPNELYYTVYDGYYDPYAQEYGHVPKEMYKQAKDMPKDLPKDLKDLPKDLPKDFYNTKQYNTQEFYKDMNDYSNPNLFKSLNDYRGNINPEEYAETQFTKPEPYEAFTTYVDKGFEKTYDPPSLFKGNYKDHSEKLFVQPGADFQSVPDSFQSAESFQPVRSDFQRSISSDARKMRPKAVRQDSGVKKTNGEKTKRPFFINLNDLQSPAVNVVKSPRLTPGSVNLHKPVGTPHLVSSSQFSRFGKDREEPAPVPMGCNDDLLSAYDVITPSMMPPEQKNYFDREDLVTPEILTEDFDSFFDAMPHKPDVSSDFADTVHLEVGSPTSSQTGSIEDSDVKKKKKQKGAVCAVCNKYISRDISRHMRIHDDIGRFQCVYPKFRCPHKTQNFNRPYDYKKHLLHMHFKFDDPKGKAVHTLTDKLPMPGSCIACGKKFENANAWLEEHVLGEGGCEYKSSSRS